MGVIICSWKVDDLNSFTQQTYRASYKQSYFPPLRDFFGQLAFRLFQMVGWNQDRNICSSHLSKEWEIRNLHLYVWQWHATHMKSLALHLQLKNLLKIEHSDSKILYP